MSETTNYKLHLTDDGSERFIDWREKMNGTNDSNMIKIDTALGEKGTYSKPSGGIPKADLASAVRESLELADSALQSHQSLSAYRTSAAQDEIDGGKQAKIIVTGMLAGSGNGVVRAAVAGTDYVAVNDSRLTDARTPKEHSHAQSDITGLAAALSGKETSGTAAVMLNRTTNVNAADTHYTTLMARGESLNSSDTTPAVNGAIAWTYA